MVRRAPTPAAISGSHNPFCRLTMNPSSASLGAIHRAAVVVAFAFTASTTVCSGPLPRPVCEPAPVGAARNRRRGG
jgi:hypothetical protein